MEPERLKAIIEAALLASPQPMRPDQLAELFDAGLRPDLAAIGQALLSLAGDCEGRGIELVEVASGFRYQVRGEVFPHLGALWTERPSRYSRALLETLALMAYRQPTTRGEIEQIRGVSVSTSILRTLEERGWVRVVGHRDVPGKPALYGTTKAFLDYFSLRSLDELPPLSALRDLEALEPQLDLEGAIGATSPAANDAAIAGNGSDDGEADIDGDAGDGDGDQRAEASGADTDAGSPAESNADDAGTSPSTATDTGIDARRADEAEEADEANNADQADQAQAAATDTFPEPDPTSDPDDAGHPARTPDPTVDPVDRY
ncbi:MAG: SMC-Scp complex subunit ScpB [Xanthomonadales bacterium]|nr:SMC-Scp complex subunit ScpB [Xanthomonadales bacterium]